MLFINDDNSGGSRRKSQRKTWALPDVLTIPVQNEREEIVEQIILEKTYNPITGGGCRERPTYRRSVRRIDHRGKLEAALKSVEEDEGERRLEVELDGPLPSWCSKAVGKENMLSGFTSFIHDEEEGNDDDIEEEDDNVFANDKPPALQQLTKPDYNTADLIPLMKPALRRPLSNQPVRGAVGVRKVQHVRPIIVVNDVDDGGDAATMMMKDVGSVMMPDPTPESILNASLNTRDWKEATSHMTKKDQLALWKVAKEEAKRNQLSVSMYGGAGTGNTSMLPPTSNKRRRRMSSESVESSTSQRGGRPPSAGSKPPLATRSKSVVPVGSMRTARKRQRVEEPAPSVVRSEGQPATSISHAATSKSQLATSRGHAATSKSLAATSKSHTATSKSLAATSKSHAATSKSNAATSKSQAATSKNDAATSKSHAATSKSHAATSRGRKNVARATNTSKTPDKKGEIYDYKKNSRLSTRECLAPRRTNRQ